MPMIWQPGATPFSSGCSGKCAPMMPATCVPCAPESTHGDGVESAKLAANAEGLQQPARLEVARLRSVDADAPRARLVEVCAHVVQRPGILILLVERLQQRHAAFELGGALLSLGARLVGLLAVELGLALGDRLSLLRVEPLAPLGLDAPGEAAGVELKSALDAKRRPRGGQLQRAAREALDGAVIRGLGGVGRVHVACAGAVDHIEHLGPAIRADLQAFGARVDARVQDGDDAATPVVLRVRAKEGCRADLLLGHLRGERGRHRRRPSTRFDHVQ
eukprot:2178535-Prymnesium_polylepis.2